MTLEFQNQISIQPTDKSGGGGGESMTITVPNLSFNTASYYITSYPKLNNGVLKPTGQVGWIPVKPTGALSSFHFHLKFTTGTIPTSGYYILMGQAGGNYNPPQIEVEDGKIHFITNSSNVAWNLWLEAIPEDNTTYTMDVTWDNVSQKVVGTLLKEGETVPIAMTVPSGKTDVLPSYTWATYSTIGGEGDSVWNGTIDLKECYIEWNNGELRWDGLTTTTITKSTDYVIQAFEALGGVQQI